jgi:hypothetical protein
MPVGAGPVTLVLVPARGHVLVLKRPNGVVTSHRHLTLVSVRDVASGRLTGGLNAAPALVRASAPAPARSMWGTTGPSCS